MDKPNIIYAPDAMPDAELDVLSTVYAFILRCGEARRAEETKKAAHLGGPDMREESESDSHAAQEYTG